MEKFVDFEDIYDEKDYDEDYDEDYNEDDLNYEYKSQIHNDYNF